MLGYENSLYIYNAEMLIRFVRVNVRLRVVMGL